MLLLDVNVCLHGLYHDASEESRSVAEWLDRAVDGDESIGLSSIVLAAMLRIGTNRRIYSQANDPDRPLAYAEALRNAPTTTLVAPGNRHWPIFTALVREHGLVANDVQDAYLAAMALELGATFVTRDRGFRRFARLRTLDPLDAEAG